MPLCEWGENASNFTIEKLPDRSSSASCGCVHVHVPAYRWVNFGSFAKACHSKFFYSGFLFFLEQQRAHPYDILTKNQERTTLPSTTSDQQRARVKCKNVCKSKARRDGADLKAHYCVTSIFARNTGTWAFFRTPFSTTFCWRTFLKPTGID